MWPLIRKNKQSYRKRIALCLNSSFFGFYSHAGFLLELHRMGIIPDRVSGASAGAIVAGLYAAGLEPDYIVRLFLKKNLNRSFWEISLPKKVLRLLFHRRGATGLLTGTALLELIKKEVGEMKIEDCPASKLEISVANISKNKQELKSEGPLAQTILASCSVPGMFEAQKMGSDSFWDGGIADPVPFEQWILEPEIDTIVVHLAINQSSNKSQDFEPGLWQGLGGAGQIINDEIIRMKIKMAKLARKNLIVLKTITPASGPTKMHLGSQNVMFGRKTVHKHIKLLKSLL